MELSENRKMLQAWKSFELNVVYAGFARTGPEWRAEHVCSPFSRLYFILKGEGLAHCAGKTVRLREGCVYLIPAGLNFGYSCEAFMEQLFFHVNVNGQNGMDFFRDCGRILEKKKEDGQGEKALELYRSERAADAFRLKGLLWEELAGFAEAAGLQETALQSCSGLINRFFFLAQNPVSASSHIRELAGQLHVSESTLSKRFRAETGMTPGAYLNRLVLDKACQLLLSEEESIAAVAERLGFSDQFYFTKYFRRQMNMTPSAYRKLMRRG
ncbi:MAG TPA: AraC family transcriptional regulator [Candidatus Eisenbergiella merdavium]|uniref:AraC family transcriptional regulator n=1 Tax=Candidatus Eisenbergiella merdavium TaxID=2838551 RepID=A0A9D2SSG4_9FIRM|nr:AraC family transcriptional regulator [Candidatus Eisenbergiella merdavium]